MTRKEDRSERARQRSEENRRQRRVRLRFFSAALFLNFGVPLLWYGAVEFSLVRPIHTAEFADSLHGVGLILTIVVLWLAPGVLFRKPEDLESAEDSKPASTTPVAIHDQ